MKREVVGTMQCLDGKARDAVEVRRTADGWVALDSRGYVWGRDRRQSFTVVQQDEKRWVVLDGAGEIHTGGLRADDLERTFESLAAATDPLWTRAWQWSGGRPLKSLAEWDASCNRALDRSADAEAQRRAG